MSKYNFKINGQHKCSEIKTAIGLDPNTKGGTCDTGYIDTVQLKLERNRQETEKNNARQLIYCAYFKGNCYQCG